MFESHGGPINFRARGPRTSPEVDRPIESVWDYPRPPELVPFEGQIKVFDENRLLAKSVAAYRILETSHPPTFYVPPDDVDAALLEPMLGASYCDWKGPATYYRLRSGDHRIEQVGWSYLAPMSAFVQIAGYYCFCPRKVNCFVDGEGVLAQAGEFYGGWITSWVRGPFKGGPGTWSW